MRSRRSFRSLVSFVTMFLAAPTLVFAAEEAEEVSRHLGVPDTIWKWANLLLFLGLLIWFAGRPIGEALRKRREEIQAKLADAAQKREQAARTEQEIRARIAALEADAADFARRAKEEGEKEKAELISRGQIEAEKVLVQAREEVESLGAAARRELAAYAGELATEIAAKSIESKLDTKGREDFLDRAIDEVGQVEGSR